MHETRVVLRRWESIWTVLERDGWNEKNSGSAPAIRLERYTSSWGQARDWDVNLELADEYALPDSVKRFLRKSAPGQAPKLQNAWKK